MLDLIMQVSSNHWLNKIRLCKAAASITVEIGLISWLITKASENKIWQTEIDINYIIKQTIKIELFYEISLVYLKFSIYLISNISSEPSTRLFHILKYSFS